MISSWSENDIYGAKPSDFGAAVRDLEPRSKLCLGRLFLKKKTVLKIIDTLIIMILNEI